MASVAVGSRLAASQHFVQPSQTIQLCERSPSKKARRAPVTSGSGSDRDDSSDKGKGETPPVDWDNAWSSYRKQKKVNPFKIDMEKYVSRRPTRSDYPLREEIDPLRKAERSALGAWTDPRFTYAGVGVILGLFVYMVIIVGPPPS